MLVQFFHQGLDCCMLVHRCTSSLLAILAGGGASAFAAWSLCTSAEGVWKNTEPFGEYWRNTVLSAKGCSNRFTKI